MVGGPQATPQTLVVVDALVVGVALLAPPTVIAEWMRRMNVVAINRRRVADEAATVEETA